MIDDQGELQLEDIIIEHVEIYKKADPSRKHGEAFVRNLAIIVGGDDWEEVSREVLQERPELLKVFEGYVE